MEDTVGNPIFQQEGTKIHTARDTMAWFVENNIQVMKWPPNSPDLNAIEHSWKRVKGKLHQYFPNSHKVKGGPETFKKHVAEALNQVWAPDIQGEFLAKLWESLFNTIAAVLDARAW